MACLRGFEPPTFGSNCQKTPIMGGPVFRDEVRLQRLHLPFIKIRHPTRQRCIANDLLHSDIALLSDLHP